MARTTLDTQLHEIRTRIIHLGTLVETALEQAIQAMQSSDLALCGLVIESDWTIDEVRSEIEQLTFQSLTLQQPLQVMICGFSRPLLPSQETWNGWETTQQELRSCCCV